MDKIRVLMDEELKTRVVPVLRSMGFSGSYPHFRRPSEQKIDLLTFQFDRWGGGFVIEISSCDPGGITTYWGKVIPPNRVTAWDLSPTNRERIQPRMNTGVEGWFRFDNGQVKLASAQVLEMLPQAEAWWLTSPANKD